VAHCSPIAETFCLPRSSGKVDGYARWPLTATGATARAVNGTCEEPYIGSPSRVCNTDGQWEETVQNPCASTAAPGAVALAPAQIV